MTDIVHVPQLSEFDRLLAHGPYYKKLALYGALAGGAVSLFAGRHEARGNLGHAVSYAIGGTGLAIGGAFLLFQFGRFVSERSHEAVEEAAAGEYAAGWHGGHHHHHHQHPWDQGNDGWPQQHHHGWSHHGHW
ncbi:MAG TPA: hypothetical protein VMN82_04955 [Thermoanaerobaculia bacterium]|nr:hypothetical protein [Thermoanaerobaculia bacterium]